MKQVQWMTTTALLIALSTALQIATKFVPLGPLSNFLTGSLVNCCLLLAAGLGGFSCGAVVGCFTPVLAFFLGAAVPPLFLPVVSLGNVALVLCASLLTGRRGAILSAAAAKTAVLWVGVIVVTPLLNMPQQQSTLLLYLFSWPKFVTAILGGGLFKLTAPKLKSALLGRADYHG